MFHIAYYINPSIELNDPLFRFGTLKSIILPEAIAIKNLGYDVTIILSDILFNHLQKQQDIPIEINFIKIKEADYNIFNNNAFQQSILLYDDIEVENYIEFYKQKLIDIIDVDVVLSYETPSDFLRKVLPNSVILNYMFGSFSRAPFPTMAALDPYGLYKKSFLSLYSEQIKNYEIIDEEKNVLKLFRREITKSLSTYLPFKRFIDEQLNLFESVVLFACQIDNYFAYNVCTDAETTQYSSLLSILQNTPNNIGVVVTEHAYKKQLTTDQIEHLKNNFSNFIYLESKVLGASQYLLPYFDGLITTSSSLGFQSALWRKPLFIVGDSQLEPLGYSKNYDDFCSAVLAHEISNKDNVLYYILSHYNIGYRSEIFKNTEKYIHFIESVVTGYKNEQGFATFSMKKTPKEMLNILVNDMRGWLLRDESISYKSQIQTDHFRVLLSESRVISFDLFDTLAERDFCQPHDLFVLLNNKVQTLIGNKNFDFSYIRRKAEADTRRPTKGAFEITLNDIYEEFEIQTGLSKSVVEQIKYIEISAELLLVHPKKRMIREFFFSEMLNDGRNIITDIYLDQKVIEEILDKIGVFGYDVLLVSAETKTRKHNGSIFPEYIKLVKNSFGVEANRMLHIGDNPHADGKMAESYGIRSYVFPKAIDNISNSLLGKELVTKSTRMGSITASTFYGLVANKFYASHWNYRNIDNLFNGNTYQYGYIGLGPLVLGFVQWLYERAKKQNIKHLYFLARDGWILKNAYDQLYSDDISAPKSYYLYCSRRAVMVPSIKNLDDIYEIASLNFNPRSFSSLLENRFGIIWNDIPVELQNELPYKASDIVSIEYGQRKLRNALFLLNELIIGNATKERESYISYLESIDFVENANNENVAVVDIGYSGSMQFYLKKILELNTLSGFYYLTHHASRNIFKNDIFEGFLGDLDDHKTSFRHPLNNYVFIFESALSSLEGSLLKINGIGKNRKLNLLHAEEEKARLCILDKIHKGCEDFVRDFIARFGDYKDEIRFSPILSSSVILHFAQSPSPKDSSMFVNFQVENLFGGGSVCLIEPPDFLTTKNVTQLIERSKWKKGAEVFYNELINKNNPNSNKPTIQVNDIKNTVKKDQKQVPLTKHDVKNKKLNKLYRNPYLFFNDSKKVQVRIFKYMFKDTVIGKFNTKILRKIIE